jgi:tetratricopeptide (TPR) repeat protein
MRRRKRWLSVSVLTITLVMVSGPSLWANRHYDYSDIDRLMSIHYKSLQLMKERKYQEALGPAEQALRLAKRIYEDAPDHDNVEVMMQNLAVIYMNLGRYSEAEPIFKQILTTDEKLTGPNDPEVARSLDNLANLYSAQGRHDEAEPLYRRALTIREKVFGPDHPATAQSRRNLGLMNEPRGQSAKAKYASKKQSEEAQRLMELAKSLPRRTITLLIAADEEFRRLDDWENAIRSHITTVSDVFDKTFHIRFKLVGILPWNSNNRVSSINAMIEELDVEVQGGDVEIMLGLSGQRPPPGEESRGGAAPLTSIGLVLLLGDEPDVQYPAGIAHEICHLFGAWHVADQGSVMHKGPTTLAFDEQTARIIRLMHGFDFRRGVSNIDEETKREILTIFQEARAPKRENPLTVAYSNLSGKLLDQGKFDEAIAVLREALRLDPNHANARHNLVATYNNQGAELLEQGKFDEAIAVLREALRLDPNDTDTRHNLVATYNNQGAKLGGQGKYTEAIAALRKALHLDPDQAEARQNLIAAYTSQGAKLGGQGKYTEAITALREALRLDPNRAEARQNLIAAYTNQGAKLFGQGNYAKAIAKFSKALDLDPDNSIVRLNMSSAFNNLVVDLIKGEKYSKAWNAVHKAQRFDVKVAPANLAILRKRMPEPDSSYTLGE